MKARLVPLGAGLTNAAAAAKLEGPGRLKRLIGLLGGKERGGEQPQDEGGNGQKRDGGANFAEM